ncbi:unnamed protein product [Mortierella alpina]
MKGRGLSVYTSGAQRVGRFNLDGVMGHTRLLDATLFYKCKSVHNHRHFTPAFAHPSHLHAYTVSFHYRTMLHPFYRLEYTPQSDRTSGPLMLNSHRNHSHH